MWVKCNMRLLKDVFRSLNIAVVALVVPNYLIAMSKIVSGDVSTGSNPSSSYKNWSMFQLYPTCQRRHLRIKVKTHDMRHHYVILPTFFHPNANHMEINIYMCCFVTKCFELRIDSMCGTQHNDDDDTTYWCIKYRSID